ncbi:hypothetical protein CDD81_5010 [Ophiocordyceps australis]|uniref:Uncharacterized protein n=1 Tax=Ophiocordyceps australis TaxID=1399860 RepID=A0A2C5Y3R4_9HYPO|nr:hypothetical protein CDD81_5010 [Ophiocordyceps australis]
MQARLLHRESGDLSPQDLARSVTSDLMRSFAPAPHHGFSGQPRQSQVPLALQQGPHAAPAHAAGMGGVSSASSLAVDKFDGRVLVSGGAEGVIKLWDLEQCSNAHQAHTFWPVHAIARSASGTAGQGHSHGVTHVAFYPFDPDAFLSSSYDKSLKLWSTSHAALSASFDLNATIYSHAMSPIADHVLVACATQHSNVRLVDLKSGSAVQALVAHGGPVLCVAWSPRHDKILVSGHADGRVRVWDVRRAGGVLAQLDQDDSLGILQKLDEAAAEGSDWHSMPRFTPSAQAHDEAVNGLQWTDDGHYIVSAGLDRRIRVWDADTGANTLASFGSLVQNKHAKTVSMLVAPSTLSSTGDLLFWPNDQEILVLDLHNGTMVTRLRIPGAANPVGPRARQADRSRITSIAWRGAGGNGRRIAPVMGGGNSVGAIYSAHMDGHIRAWMPRIPGPEELDEADELNHDEQVKLKKRKAVDSAYRSLMGKQIKFT